MSAPIDNAKSRAFLVFPNSGQSSGFRAMSALPRNFPASTVPTIQAWLDDFKAMDALVWKLAEEGGKANFHLNDFYQSFSRAYPWLDKSGLDRAWSRCAYYICHEGHGSWRTD